MIHTSTAHDTQLNVITNKEHITAWFLDMVLGALFIAGAQNNCLLIDIPRNIDRETPLV